MFFFKSVANELLSLDSKNNYKSDSAVSKNVKLLILRLV